MSFFIQDTWQAGRFTVRPGVRYERQYLEGIEPALGPELCFEGDERPGEGSGVGAPIACNFTWNNWAPRIGATLDLTGGRARKGVCVLGSVLRKDPSDLAARAMSADAGITRAEFLDPGLTQPIPNGALLFGTTTHLIQSSPHAAVIDPDSGST